MLFAFTSVLTLISTYFIFNEKANRYQLFGMALLISCAIVLGFSGRNGKSDIVTIDGNEVEVISKFIPIGIAIIATWYFWFRTLLIKIFRVKLNFSVPELMSYSLCNIK